MGKKPAKKGKASGQQNKTTNVKGDSHLYPFVSICTPTFNRRPFWPMAIQCFNDYDYPKDRMEWIIVDDGSDKIEDLVKDIPQVKYFREEQQMVLGRKRNYMHEKAKGDIIVYQDDDDYYPPDRISHAVEKLMSDPKVLAGGSTVLFLYFKHIQQMYRFGPYSEQHATAGTFAFKRELLKETKYDDFKALAEEKDFLKNYTVPFIQFDPLKTILVFSHNHNTFDKKKLLEHAPNPTCNPDMNITVDHIVKSESAKKFFLEDIDDILSKYEPGDVKNKPEVLNQTKLLEEQRNIHQQELSDLRRETLLRKDVKQVLAEAQATAEAARKESSRIFEVNKRLVHRMKAISHILTNEDKALIEETEKKPQIADVGISNPRLVVRQTEQTCAYDPQSIQNIFSFLANHSIELELIINNAEKCQASFKANLEFIPHPSQQHHYTGGAQPQTKQVDLNKALNSNISSNVNEDDIQTIIDQTECNRATAINALNNENNDVISCIMNIDNYRCEDVPKKMSTDTNDDDIQTIMEQTQCSKEIAINALEKENGDVISCIMNIDKYKSENNSNNTTHEISINVADIERVMKETNCNQMSAIHAIANEENNINNAIKNIDKYMVQDSTNVLSTIPHQTPTENIDTTEDDIKTVMEQGDCDRETALRALKEENNDVISCIMNIDSYRNNNKETSEENISLSIA